MGTLNYLFAPFYWKTHIEETGSILDRYLAQIQANVESQPTLRPFGWDCNVHTNYNVPNMQLDPGVLGGIYQKYLQQFWAECRFQPATMKIQQPWYNCYSQNQFQEFHGHLPNDFSAVHYLVFDEKEHPATTFINTNPALSQAIQIRIVHMLSHLLHSAGHPAGRFGDLSVFFESLRQAEPLGEKAHHHLL